MKTDNANLVQQATGIRRAFFSIITFAMVICFFVPRSAQAMTAEELDQQVPGHDTSFYRDFFDSVVYEPVAGLLRFDELWDTIAFRKHPALDVNAFDEVPDSGFFENRHGKTKMSVEALAKGPSTGTGPDPSGPWRVLKGKVEGVTTGFFIEDNKGVKYLLKFDPKDNPEMATSSEIITHKFFHAIGYHVPEYYLVKFKPSILEVDANATYYDENGFKKPLTKKALWGLIGRIPKMKGGVLRASASKLLLNSKGYMNFTGRRKSDPDDMIQHENRRSIRGIRVFASWLNHYDLRQGNTLDVIETKDGEARMVHYLIDFGSTLGSAAHHPKYPASGHEHVVDLPEIAKATTTLKLFNKPWEKRWDEAGQTITNPSVGYLDNVNFEPDKWKAQLDQEVFDRLTPSDAFWAAKIVTAFSDEEIRAIVETGKLSDSDGARIISDVLIERRDLIGKYWFSRVTPLDQVRLFHVDGDQYEISFADLSAQRGYASDVTYKYRIQGGDRQEFSGTSFSFDSGGQDRLTLSIQARSAGEHWSKPPLNITLAQAGGSKLQIVGIDRGV